MLRCLLVATLITTQGLYSLAGATLCLHADGGFCVERAADNQCRHHQPAAKTLCCTNHAAQPDLGELSIGASPCVCRHLAIADDPELSPKRSSEEIQLLNSGPIVVSLIVPKASLAAKSPAKSWDKTCAWPSAALSFLAPVMLRC